MAKQPRESKPETEAPTEHEEQAPHPLGHDGDTSNKVTVEGDWTWDDEDYWAREQEYHNVFDVYTTMHDIAHSVGVSWCLIENYAGDKVQRHAMTQTTDDAMEEALWLAGKNCASLTHMLAAHGKEIVCQQQDGNTDFYIRDSRTGEEEIVWDEEQEQASRKAN